jgi:thioredoxin reductase (NADPH)
MTKKFFGEQRVHYEFIDVDMDKDGLAFVEKVNNDKQIIPTLVFEDGSTLVEPSNAELAARLGLQTAARNTLYDLIVIGSGPAGLTAALYAAREGIDTLVIERGGVGGQAGITERLDNFPGLPEGISGSEFADRLRQQAERFGVEILQAQEVTEVSLDDQYRCVKTSDGKEYGCWAVLLALGSTYRRLEIPGEDDFIGAGVHFCATCDGPFYRGKEVLVVGGGNSAGEESIFLTRFASKVTIVTRDPDLTASQIVAEKVRENPQIEVITNTSPAEFKGKNRLETVVLKNVQDRRARRRIRPHRSDAPHRAGEGHGRDGPAGLPADRRRAPDQRARPARGRRLSGWQHQAGCLRRWRGRSGRPWNPALPPGPGQRHAPPRRDDAAGLNQRYRLYPPRVGAPALSPRYIPRRSGLQP